MSETKTVTLDGTTYKVSLDYSGDPIVEQVSDIDAAIDAYVDEHPVIDDWQMPYEYSGNGPEVGTTVVFECTLADDAPGRTHIGTSRRTTAARHLDKEGVGISIRSFEEKNGRGFYLHGTIVDEDDLD